METKTWVVTPGLCPFKNWLWNCSHTAELCELLFTEYTWKGRDGSLGGVLLAAGLCRRTLSSWPGDSCMAQATPPLCGRWVMCGDRAIIIYATVSDRCNEHQHHPLTQDHSKLGFAFLLQCDHLRSCLGVKKHSKKWIITGVVTLQKVRDQIFFRKAGRTGCCFCESKNIRLLFWEPLDVAVHYSSGDIFSAINLVTRQKNIYSKIAIVNCMNTSVRKAVFIVFRTSLLKLHPQQAGISWVLQWDSCSCVTSNVPT